MKTEDDIYLLIELNVLIVLLPSNGFDDSH
jgi:hypothetical protein